MDVSRVSISGPSQSIPLGTFFNEDETATLSEPQEHDKEHHCHTAPSRVSHSKLKSHENIKAGTSGNGSGNVSSWRFLQTPYWSLYRPLKDCSSRAILVLGIVCSIAAGVPLPIIGVIFSEIIDTFPPPAQELRTSIAELLAVAVAYLIVTWIWSTCWSIVGERTSRRFREALVEKIIGLDKAYYDVQDLDITDILTSSTQKIQIGTSEKVGLFIQSISYFAAAFVVGFILNATLTGILFAAIIPAMTISVVTGSSLVSKMSKQAEVLYAKAASVAEDAISSVQVIQAFDAFDALSDEHYTILNRALRYSLRKSATGAIMVALVYFICYAANAIAFHEGSRLSGGSPGRIYAVVFLILDASFVVGQFGPFIQIFANAAAAGSKVMDIVDCPPPLINVYSQEGFECDEDVFEAILTLRNISFRYPARQEALVLNNVNLKIEPGTMTGIVGLSGSGKSTIASLLLRLYDPTSGEVYLGHHPLSKFRISSLRSRISLVGQDPILFSGSILDNIRYGIVHSEEFSEEEVLRRCWEAAVAANAQFVSELPQGIHTKVGMAGSIALSGGQRQRICLARAIVRRPKILVLDEPTSALDTSSEALILESLKNVSQSGCTIIMIAHRLATIRHAHNIVLMGYGEVLGEGTHDELLRAAVPYRRLVEAQGMQDGTANIPSQSLAEQGSVSSYGSSDFKNGESSEDKSLEDVQKAPQMSLKEILQRCLALSRPERGFVIMGILASIATGAVVVGEAIIFGHLVSILNNRNANPAEIKSDVDFYSIMFVVLSVAALVGYSISGSCFGFASDKLTVRVRDISLRTILRQDLAWFTSAGRSPARLKASISSDSGNLASLSGVIIGNIFSVSTSIVGGIILAHVVAWRIAILLTFVAVPIMIIAGFLRLRVLAKAQERHETAYSEAAAFASEACHSITTVAALGREAGVLKDYRAIIQKPYAKSLRFHITSNFILAFSLAITYFVYSLAYWWGANLVRQGEYSQEDFFIVLPALLFSAQASGQVFSLAPEVTRARSAASNVFRLHDEKPTIMDKRSKCKRPDDQEKANAHDDDKKNSDQNVNKKQRLSSEQVEAGGRIEIRNATLSYQARAEVAVLEDINLAIEPGQFIGIVGPSGAGKSSLVALLERFYDVQQGTIMLDGQDIRHLLSVQEYRSKLSLVPQEPDLFAGSIAFNVRLGAKPGQSVSQADVERVCKDIGLHDFISSLPDGYETECGNNGSKLSGGQKQRVAVARALIRDPEILLLDEATASLDSLSERQVHQAVLAASKGRTTIVIAHRLSTVQQADHIFVLDRGRVAEHGRHRELLSNGGLYASMAQQQSLAS